MFATLSALLIMIPSITKAAPGLWEWHVVSPDTWIENNGGNGDMNGGEQHSSTVFLNDYYVSGISYSNGPVLWKYDANGDKSWSDVTLELASGTSSMTGLLATNDTLYATTGNNSGSELWSYDGESWTSDEDLADQELQWISDVTLYKNNLCVYGWKVVPVVYCKINGSWTSLDLATAGAVQGGARRSVIVANADRLYVNTRDENNDDVLFSFDGEVWTSATLDNLISDADAAITDMIINSEGQLIFATTNHDGEARVFKKVGDVWERQGALTNFDEGSSVEYHDILLANYNSTILAVAGDYLTTPVVYELTGSVSSEDAWDVRSEDWFGHELEDGEDPFSARTLVTNGGDVYIGTAVAGEGDYYNKVWLNGESEDNSGNGEEDLNDDGTPDSEQNNVSSFISPITNKPVAIELNEQCDFNEAELVTESSRPAQDVQYDYANGLFNFTADCEVATTTVRLFHYDVSKDNLVLRKFNPNSNSYYDISNATIEEQTMNDHLVTIATYQITDGGELDMDGKEDGSIADPAGLGSRVSVNDEDLASTGHARITYIITSALLITLSGMFIAKRAINNK